VSKVDKQLILDSGPNVVVRSFQGGGDVLNAWEVLSNATGSDMETEKLVEAACKRLGVDFYAVIKEIQNQINDRRRNA
jgi:hypothetical protein